MLTVIRLPDGRYEVNLSGIPHGYTPPQTVFEAVTGEDEAIGKFVGEIVIDSIGKKSLSLTQLQEVADYVMDKVTEYVRETTPNVDSIDQLANELADKIIQTQITDDLKYLFTMPIHKDLRVEECCPSCKRYLIRHVPTGQEFIGRWDYESLPKDKLRDKKSVEMLAGWFSVIDWTGKVRTHPEGLTCPVSGSKIQMLGAIHRNTVAGLVAFWEADDYKNADVVIKSIQEHYRKRGS